MICSRCDQETNNNNQGHYWAFCKKTGKMEKFHFCCPELPCNYEEGNET